MDKGWPVDDTPLAVHVGVVAAMRNDQPVAILQLVDPTGDMRQVQLTPAAAMAAIEGLAGFCSQVIIAHLEG